MRGEGTIVLKGDIFIFQSRTQGYGPFRRRNGCSSLGAGEEVVVYVMRTVAEFLFQLCPGRTHLVTLTLKPHMLSFGRSWVGPRTLEVSFSPNLAPPRALAQIILCPVLTCSYEASQRSIAQVKSPGCMETEDHNLPERIKKMPETKASMVRWGRMCPMLLRMNPMNMKKRLTSGKGVAERIISNAGGKGTACQVTTVTFLPHLIPGSTAMPTNRSSKTRSHKSGLGGSWCWQGFCLQCKACKV